METPENPDQNLNSQPEKEQESLISESLFEMAPFEHYCVLGRTTKVPALNLTIDKHPRILYAASNIAVIYDSDKRSTMELRGHRNIITQISTDETGRWIATSDCDKDSAVIIWDSTTGVPVHTMFNVYPHGCDIVQLSPCGRYLITVSNSDQRILHLWEWVFGHEKANESICFDKEFGTLNTVCFSPDMSECLMVTSDRYVAFLTYEKGEFRSHIPDTSYFWDKKSSLMRFTDSTFIDGTNSHSAVTVTNFGCVLVWSDQMDNNDIPADVNQKKLVLQFRRKPRNMTSVRSFNKIVIIADSQGYIKFYDDHFDFLYCFDQLNLDYITSIQLDCQSKEKNPENICNANIHGLDSPGKNNITKCSQPGELSLEDLYLKIPPTDNILVSTQKGLVAYIDVSEQTIKYLLQPYSDATAIDSHPSQPYFCVGTKNSSVMLIDYLAKRIIIQNTIIGVGCNSCQKVENDSMSPITCLKYSPDGYFLACGLENGNIWLLSPLALKKTLHYPVINSKGAITIIEFSDDSYFMAVADSELCVSLVIIKNKIQFLGKYRSHYKTVNDITFYLRDKDCQLYSVGEDRSLVEYDLQKSVSEMKITIKCIYRIDQCGRPLCVLPYPYLEFTLLLCNSQGKFRIIDTTSKQCIKTAQEPMLQHPIHKIKVLPLKGNEKSVYFVYAAGNYVGIQKMPLDGNPYKNISVLGSATHLKDIRCSFDGSFVFTISNNDECIHIWQTFRESVDILEQLGGSGLEPYYCMLDGGKYGSLMNDIKDFFYYCQIIHEGENLTGERPTSNSLPLCEIADFMRTIGFYPSDYDVTNMLHELGCNAETDKSNLTYRISFEDLVKLYINHRDTIGITEKMLRDAFETFATDDKDEGAVTTNPFISRKNFYAILEDTGEMLNNKEIINYINILLSKSDDYLDQPRTSLSIPREITYNFLCNEILCTWRSKSKEMD